MTAEKARLILMQIENYIVQKKATHALAEALDKDLMNCETVRNQNHFHVYRTKDLRELAAALGKEIETSKESEAVIGFWYGDIWVTALEKREEE